MPKKPILKELFLLLVIILVCLLYKWILVPILLGNAALDINLHDTFYIYISPLHNALWIIIPVICFAIYLFRAISAGFKNSLVLVVLMLSTLFIIIWLNLLGQGFNSFYYADALNKHLATEQKQNATAVTGLFYGSDAAVSTYYYGLAVLQLILTLFIGFIGIRIGMNIKRSATDNKS